MKPKIKKIFPITILTILTLLFILVIYTVYQMIYAYLGVQSSDKIQQIINTLDLLILIILPGLIFSMLSEIWANKEKIF